MHARINIVGPLLDCNLPQQLASSSICLVFVDGLKNEETSFGSVVQKKKNPSLESLKQYIGMCVCAWQDFPNYALI